MGQLNADGRDREHWRDADERTGHAAEEAGHALLGPDLAHDVEHAAVLARLRRLHPHFDHVCTEREVDPSEGPRRTERLADEHAANTAEAAGQERLDAGCLGSQPGVGLLGPTSAFFDSAPSMAGLSAGGISACDRRILPDMATVVQSAG